MAIAVADTVDEIVELANASDYTLVASLWTKDVNTALDVAGRVRSGQLFSLPCQMYTRLTVQLGTCRIHKHQRTFYSP